MSVSVSMPQLGESVTEGTVTRWLKKEGERVEADEPLLEVSTDKVDTEIPSPVAGILRGITVAEDETVAVGAELAIIDETGAEGQAAAAEPPAAEAAAAEAPASGYAEAPAGDQAVGSPPPQADVPEQAGYPYPDVAPMGQPAPGGYQQPAAYEPPASYQPSAPQPSAGVGGPPEQPADVPPAPVPAPAAADLWQRAEPAPPPPPPAPPAAQPAQSAVVPALSGQPAAPPAPAAPVPSAPASAAPAPAAAPPAPAPQPPVSALGTAEGPYVTPLVRKLAAEHGVDLATVTGTGVGGRIRKQDVIDAAKARREAVAAAQQAAAPDGQASASPAAGQAGTAQPAAGAAQLPQQRVIEPSTLRGTTERMSRARQVIARRMVESLQTSAQLTTVVEVDVTAIARLRDRAKADFEAREGVKLSFLPFFALAAVEALKVHPRLNASIEPDGTQVTYHDAEHLGIAVDTERGLMVPVIRNAGDLNVGGLARKIADLAARTRAGQVSPDDLAGGTFTLTNTGSRGALFDTPIINQPQVGILGTGSVVRRPVVVRDPSLGEVIAVRSMVYLALSYDHRLVDGADAARFLGTVKARLEEGAFEAELGL
ncbi:MAG TPA: 2-oxoglutarate dehydrogenase, E2 component, dihydrolipoamide succinyltransferase [Streptosporangiaceae bacterium]|jgi:2-oxoglutarate dehydrogenase E2 component (dihydrolipoamide succinyltransferase)